MEDMQTKISHLGRLLAAACILALVVGPIAGCGKRGDPEPPDENSEFPRTYPAR
jgi:predicted small lipoprotein YifL